MVVCGQSTIEVIMMRKRWIAMAALLAVAGCGTVKAAPHVVAQPTIEQRFLDFVPPNEPHAPHNMKWLIEHTAQDGGYYNSKIIPGTLTVNKYPYTFASITTIDGSTMEANWVHVVDWKINGLDFEFYFFPRTIRFQMDNGPGFKPSSQYELSAASQDANLLAVTIYS